MHEVLDLVPCTTSKQDVVAYTTIPALGWKKRDARIQEHPWLHRRFATCLAKYKTMPFFFKDHFALVGWLVFSTEDGSQVLVDTRQEDNH